MEIASRCTLHFLKMYDSNIFLQMLYYGIHGDNLDTPSQHLV